MKVRLSKSSAENYVKKVVIKKDSTAFLSSQIEGRELWQIRLNDVDIRPKFSRDEGYDVWRKKSFIVLLNANTGQPLKIYSIPLSKDSICTLKHTAEKATALLSNRREVYHGFPTEPPQITFLQALNAAAGCLPLVANEIVAQYIMYSQFGRDPIPVWSITSLGVPPIHFTSYREKYKKKSNNISLDCERCLVNAISGELMSQTNVPCNKPKKLNIGESGGE